MNKYEKPEMIFNSMNEDFEVIFTLRDVSIEGALRWAQNTNEISLMTQTSNNHVTRINIYQNTNDLNSISVVFTVVC